MAESVQASMSEKLKRINLTIGNRNIQYLNDKNKWLLDYNTNLQQLSSRLKSEIATTNETLKRVENEKSVLLENLSTLRDHCTCLQEQLASSMAAQDEAIRQKEKLADEVGCLRGDLQDMTVRSNELEARCLSECEEIRRLQEQLSFAEANIDV